MDNYIRLPRTCLGVSQSRETCCWARFKANPRGNYPSLWVSETKSSHAPADLAELGVWGGGAL